MPRKPERKKMKKKTKKRKRKRKKKPGSFTEFYAGQQLTATDLKNEQPPKIGNVADQMESQIEEEDDDEEREEEEEKKMMMKEKWRN